MTRSILDKVYDHEATARVYRHILQTEIPKLGKFAIYLGNDNKKRYGFHHVAKETDVFVEVDEDTGQSKTYDYYNKRIGGRVLYSHIMRSLARDIMDLHKDETLNNKEYRILPYFEQAGIIMNRLLGNHK